MRRQGSVRLESTEKKFLASQVTCSAIQMLWLTRDSEPRCILYPQSPDIRSHQVHMLGMALWGDPVCEAVNWHSPSRRTQCMGRHRLVSQVQVLQGLWTGRRCSSHACSRCLYPMMRQKKPPRTQRLHSRMCSRIVLQDIPFPRSPRTSYTRLSSESHSRSRRGRRCMLSVWS